jgi:hypothetical protein
LFLFFLFMFGGIGLGLLMRQQMPLFMGAGFLLAFTIPWLWWSLKVVSWKIWAFSNVKDGKTLERRAISRQLIWPRGNFFEKTEIKSQRDKQTLEELYRKMDASISSKEIVIDESLPHETVIDYPKSNLYVYLFLTLASVYLIYVESYLYGVLGIGFSAYSAYDLLKKLRKKEFLLKVSGTGVMLPTGSYTWSQIATYYVEKEGYGRSITYYLILEGNGFREKISLSDVNTNAFEIERYLDVYRSRYEMKHKVPRL